MGGEEQSAAPEPALVQSSQVAPDMPPSAPLQHAAVVAGVAAEPAELHAPDDHGDTGTNAEGVVDAAASPSSSSQQPEPSEASKPSGGSNSDSDASGFSGDEGGEGATSGPSTQQQRSSGSIWAAKHPLPAPKAVGRGPPPSSPSSSGGDGGGGTSGPKRKQLFPKIRASERCGKCENCLNPQRKKACIEARRRMQEAGLQLASVGSKATGGAAAAARKQQQTPAAAAAPTAQQAAFSSDPWLRELERILSGTGGVMQPKHVPALLSLMQSAKALHQRITLLSMLPRSSPEVLASAVRQRALLPLQAWLSDAVAQGKPSLASKVLACLSKLPVTLASLQPPCELGKLVGRLRKDEGMDEPTREQARQLVAKWKKIVEAGSAAGGSSSREAAVEKLAPPTSQGGAPKAPAKAPLAAAGAKPGGPGPAAKAAAAKPVFAAVGDDDMFAAADKSRVAAKEAAANQRKVMRIEVETTRGKSDPAQPASPPGAAAAGSSAGTAAASDGSKAGASGGGASAPSASTTNASTSPFDSLSSFSAGVSMIGGASGSLTLTRIGSAYKTAADRAAEAARRVPSPEPPAERKAKRKKVAWKGDDSLMAVRWFLRADPPAAAKADVDPNAPSAAQPPAEAETEASPPGFEMAAKQEHLSEAQALRAHRIQEDEERLEMEERLGSMVPSVAWQPPPPLPAALAEGGGEFSVARGEESLEAQAQAQRRMQCPPAVYAHPSAVPPSPAEPQSQQDLGISQLLEKIPRIPLTVEATMLAHDTQQAQQAQRQQQPQPHMVTQAGVGGMFLSTHQGLQPPQQVQLAGAMQQQQQPGMPMQGLPPRVQQAQQGVNGQQMAGNLLAQLANAGLLQPGAAGLPVQQPGAVGVGAQQHPFPLPQQAQQAQQQQMGVPMFGPGQAPIFGQPGQMAPLQPPQQQQQGLMRPMGQSAMIGQPMQASGQPNPMLQQQQLQRPGGPGQGFAPGQHLGPPPQQQLQQFPGPLWQQQQQQPGAQQSLQQPPQQPPQQQQQPAHWGPKPAPPPPPRGQAPFSHQQQGHHHQQQQQQQHEGPPHRGGRPPCKFFNTREGCRMGDKCRFVHLPPGQMGGGGGGGKRHRPEEENGMYAGGPHKQHRTWDGRGPNAPPTGFRGGRH